MTAARVEAPPAVARLDRWLWIARFFPSRSRATAFAAAGRVRIDGVPAGKAHAPVRPGNVLTFALGARVRIIRVLAVAERRGPPAAARLLYEDLAAAAPVADGAATTGPGAA